MTDLSGTKLLVSLLRPSLARRIPAAPVLAAFLLAIMWAPLAPTAAMAEMIPLDKVKHVHAIAVNPAQPSNLYLATHEGLVAASPVGLATRVSTLRAHLLSLAADPADPNRLYASGRSRQSGNLGLLVSRDGGKSWQRLADGADDRASFHALTVSPANTKVLYGVYKGMRMSRDGGRTWTRVGDAPDRVFDLAASSRDARTVYAATAGGLIVSRDGGRRWRPAFMVRRPATTVHASPQGQLYAFVYGLGLFSTTEPSLAWELRADGFQDRALMDLVEAPRPRRRLYAVARTGQLVTSGDSGRTWTSYEGYDRVTPAAIGAGERLYIEYCQSCHGARGVGERPQDMYAKDEYGFVAPPLNNDAHGWHHSDQNLINTILEGSPRNPRMASWKPVLSRQDAANLVIYIKSLWNFRSLACQGSRHMQCLD